MQCLTHSGFSMSVISMMTLVMMTLTLMVMMSLVSTMPLPLSSRDLVHQNIFAKLLGQLFYRHPWGFEEGTLVVLKSGSCKKC